MSNTELTMLLNRRMALISKYEGKSQTYRANQHMVATINPRTGMFSKRFLYSADNDFFWIRENDGIGNFKQFMDAISHKCKNDGF